MPISYRIFLSEQFQKSSKFNFRKITKLLKLFCFFSKIIKKLPFTTKNTRQIENLKKIEFVLPPKMGKTFFLITPPSCAASECSRKLNCHPVAIPPAGYIPHQWPEQSYLSSEDSFQTSHALGSLNIKYKAMGKRFIVCSYLYFSINSLKIKTSFINIINYNYLKLQLF